MTVRGAGAWIFAAGAAAFLWAMGFFAVAWLWDMFTHGYWILATALLGVLLIFVGLAIRLAGSGGAKGGG